MSSCIVPEPSPVALYHAHVAHGVWYAWYTGGPNHPTKEIHVSDTIAPAPPMNAPTPGEADGHGELENPQDTDWVDYPLTGRPETEEAARRAKEAQDELKTPPTPPAALPDDGQDEEDQADPEPLNFLLGNRKLGVKVGGFKPDSSILKIKGGKIDLDGQFDMADRFPAVFTLQVTGNLDRHGIELDTGSVKSQKRAQEATICGTSTLPEYLASKLGENPALLAQVMDALGLTDEVE